MKSITITMDNAVAAKARVVAAQQGKSLSRFVSELAEQRVGRTLTQKEALEDFLAGPALHVLDEHGKTPSRDELHD